ncbi:MAG: DUF1553 domain-containing protein, partial [Planctomycetales bacterium]|nr:DUF1553 domain-containing protein [Planctomycetales bacterium]
LKSRNRRGTWQLSSNDIASNSSIDPTNIFLWRANRRRLDAEQLRDSVLMISGQLDTSKGDAHPFPHWLTYFYRQHEPFVGDFECNKRSVYLFRQRIRKNRYLDLFDGPDGNLHVGTRRATTTSLQSLYLLNSDFIVEQSQAIAKRAAQFNSTDESRLQWAYAHLFGRLPTDDELQSVNELMRNIETQSSGTKHQLPTKAADVWSTVIHSMLCSNEFLFID